MVDSAKVKDGKSAKEIRETFLRFFEERSHQRVASASLLPESDPTLMFVNAGMVPFKRLFLGEESRGYQRATSSQKCMRVSGKHNDLENVGRTPRHHTFFEMLGNFSFGDYFKRDAIAFAWDLITERLGIPGDHLVVSVFREDDEAFDIWEKEIGIPAERIYRLDEDENFWSMGDTGPCGPCSEIHYDYRPGEAYDSDDPSSETGRFLEIWNLVFMQFDRSASGEMTPLPKPCVDTGAGLERLAAVLQGAPSNYDTDLFTGILAKASECSGVALGASEESDVSLRVIADHARAVSFLVGDGVLPSNEGRGYVLRRILRRAARHGVLLGMEAPFLWEVTGAVIDEMGEAYPELVDRRAYIAERVKREEERFLETLSNGLSLLEAEISQAKERGERELPGRVVFKLYDTYGFPTDLTEDILVGHEMALDEAGFNEEMDAQRARSRESWKGSGDALVGEVYGRIAAEFQCEFTGHESLEGAAEIRVLLRDGAEVESVREGEEVELVVPATPFYPEGGGQVGDCGTVVTPEGSLEISDTRKPVDGLIVHRGRVTHGELQTGQIARLEVDAEARAATVRNHSGTHLLHAALREVLGSQAMQKGSLVSPERLRFDFTHDGGLTRDQLEAIEDRVNYWIEENNGASVRHMAYKEAIEAGAVAIFEEKYGDEVRVVSFGEASTELCGGTHAGATGDIGVLKIVSEGGVAAGIRRVEALTGLGALAYLREQENALHEIGAMLKVAPADASERVGKLLEERRELEREVSELRREARGGASQDLVSQAEEVNGLRVLTAEVEGIEGKELRGMVDELRDKLGSGVVLLAVSKDGRASLALGVTPDLTDRLRAGDLIREVAQVIGGKGGGRPDFAQAGGPDAEKLAEAFEKLRGLVAAV